MVEIRIPEDPPLREPDSNKRRILFAIMAMAAKGMGVEDARDPWELSMRIAYGDQKITPEQLPMKLINDLINAIDFHMGRGAGYWSSDGQTLVVGSDGYKAW